MGMQEGIKVINVRLSKAAVSSFSLPDETVTLELSFDDGTRKQVYKTAKLENPEEVAGAILEGIIRMEENINMEFDGEQLTGAVQVILHKYDETKGMLVHFLEDVSEKVCKLRNAKVADGYTDMLKKLQNSELIVYV